jgi:succinyl-CoA synthetase beta subunit
LAGGRGKGTFDSGLKGGVQMASKPADVKAIAAKMIGHRLVTKQTGAEGRPVNMVQITERLYVRSEKYIAFVMDRASLGPVLIASSQGGMDIEAVADETPHLIVKESIDIFKGLQPEQAERVARAIGFEADHINDVKDQLMKLYELFIKKDATLIEINPFVEIADGRIMCLDAKINFDDNVLFRQADVAAMRDPTQEDEREVQAAEHDLNYIGLDGNIACLVNGAGLAMATMDIIKLHGGEPANFLDVGGGANEKQIAEAFKLLNSDPRVQAILVNIFGGIMRCDIIALGIIKAAKEIGLKKPLVVRLEGTNQERGRELLDSSGLRIFACEDLDQAAQTSVKIAKITQMAMEANLAVKFELPI